MICTNCKKENKKEANFCEFCGDKLIRKQNEINVNNKKIINTEEEYRGLDGWLIIVIIGLFINVAMSLYNIYDTISFFFSGTPQDINKQINGYSTVLGIELIFSIAFCLVAIYLIYIFFRKSKNFPKYYIIWLVATAIFIAVDYLVVSSWGISEATSGMASDISRAFFGAVIWGSYMNKSKRVKNTFIEN